MRGRKPAGWRKGLGGSRAYGRKTAQRDRARMAAQLEETITSDTRERARRVGRLLNAIYQQEPDQETSTVEDSEAPSRDPDVLE